MHLLTTNRILPLLQETIKTNTRRMKGFGLDFVLTFFIVLKGVLLLGLFLRAKPGQLQQKLQLTLQTPLARHQ